MKAHIDRYSNSYNLRSAPRLISARLKAISPVVRSLPAEGDAGDTCVSKVAQIVRGFQRIVGTDSLTSTERNLTEKIQVHVLIVRSPGYDRVIDLLTRYTRRFIEEVPAVAAPEESPEQHL